MPALFFGSISTLADTSELQRASFNEAFAAQGLDWQWSQDEYRTLLGGNGGAARVASYARERGVSVDAQAVHAAKSTIFQQKLASAPVQARPGVVDTIRAARQAGDRIGFVTTTSNANISALLGALAPEITPADFDVIMSAADVEAAKPDPAAYLRALKELGESASNCVAVEDNPGGARAAAAAGITCVAFPNQNTADLDFGPVAAVVDHLDLAQLRDAR